MNTSYLINSNIEILVELLVITTYLRISQPIFTRKINCRVKQYYNRVIYYLSNLVSSDYIIYFILYKI